MGKWYILIIAMFLSACTKNDTEQEYTIINIEKQYPYVYETYSIKDVDSKMYELFTPTIYLINSIDTLLNNPLYIYSPKSLKEELIKCDFNNNTLVFTSCINLQEVDKIEHQLHYNNYYLEYEYIQKLYSKSWKDNIENIHFILTSFSIKKIPEDTQISFSRSFNIIEK